MKKIGAIVALKFKMLMRDKISLIWMFAAPIIFITVIVYGFNTNIGGELKIAIVGDKQNSYYKEFAALLEEENYEAYEATLTNARRDIIEGKIALAVIIPEDFENIVKMESENTVDILKMQDSVESIAMIKAVERTLNTMQFKHSTREAIVNTMEEFHLETKDVTEENVEEAYDVAKEENAISYTILDVEEANEGYDSVSYNTLGIMVLFIVFFVVNSSDGILQDKLTGTWDRLLTTGVTDFQIFTGNIISIFLLGTVQTTVLVLISRFAYKVDWGNSVPGLIGLFAAFLFCITGIALIIGVIVSSKKQLVSVTAIVVMPTSLLAGCMWSRDIMSEMLLKISDFMPQSWIIVGVTNLVANQCITNVVTKSMAVLFQFGILYFCIGLFIFMIQRKVKAN